MPLSNEDAIAQTRELARTLGLACEPIVLADKSNLVMHLTPHPVVARAAMATSLARIGMEWLRREVDITRHLAARGASVTRPASSIDAGPFERGELVVSFWELERMSDAPIDPHLAGVRLGEAHRLLRDFPELQECSPRRARTGARAASGRKRPERASRWTAQLPEWGAWTEARAVIERARGSEWLDASERRRLDHAVALAENIVASSRARSASFQPVHGDAHIANVLSTTRGPVWADWEDAFVGPIEWDLACLRSKLDLFGEQGAEIEATLAGYDVEHDEALVHDLGLVRNVVVIGWLGVFAERQPELSARMRARLERLPPT